MPSIMSIDPGPDQSGWCVFHSGSVIASGVKTNEAVLDEIRHTTADFLAIERVASYGMSVGRDVFETCEWVGDFRNEWRRKGLGEAILIYRRDVKLHLCGSLKANDSNIRQAILDMFPRSGGGKTPQVGTKLQPGPLHGVSSHAWSALAVCITAQYKIYNGMNTQ